MESVIPPVDRKLLLKELADGKLLRESNMGKTEIYVFSHEDSPNLMKELGRVREITFRDAGGGTGLSCDIDTYDISETPYLQLIVWDPEELEIIGGYRFIHGASVLDNPIEKLATSPLFSFSDLFLKEYLPYTIELGRSFVQPKYQQGNQARKGLFALDNLWDGIGALTIEYPDIKYFFGKVTMYKSYDVEARNHLLAFMNLYFPDKQHLVSPIAPIEVDFKKYQNAFRGNSYRNDYKTLSNIIRKSGERIPPLINTYMNISSSMKTFGTVDNPHFGAVEETGILVNISDIYSSKKDRHILTYKRISKLSSIISSKLKMKVKQKRKL